MRWSGLGASLARDPAVHVAIDARRQQPAARRHRRCERGRIPRAVPGQRHATDDNGRAPQHPRRARDHGGARDAVHEPRALHRRGERGRARSSGSVRRPSTSRVSCSRAWCSARSARSTTSPSRRRRRSGSCARRSPTLIASRPVPVRAAHRPRPHRIDGEHARAGLRGCLAPAAGADWVCTPECRVARQRHAGDRRSTNSPSTAEAG